MSPLALCSTYHGINSSLYVNELLKQCLSSSRVFVMSSMGARPAKVPTVSTDFVKSTSFGRSKEQEVS